ncbi:hypothetical protein ACLETV_24250 [Citrobacter braakii]|uniref:hypothetical protein n=1 Tax=Citrobacter TaxID=544 RepID=UPI001BC161F3|nr:MULTISPECIES: hypothetical protein [Citrobacter]MDM3329342.1 hypothetical protein [Citrobacter sp. Cb130]HEB0901754.1 hypothetical protein [Citrobacter freundii]HEB0906474.1 hypothetical protein [Citrobacter freundii]
MTLEQRNDDLLCKQKELIARLIKIEREHIMLHNDIINYIKDVEHNNHKELMSIGDKDDLIKDIISFGESDCVTWLEIGKRYFQIGAMLIDKAIKHGE